MGIESNIIAENDFESQKTLCTADQREPNVHEKLICRKVEAWEEKGHEEYFAFSQASDFKRAI